MKYYVYLLLDPSNCYAPIYVGKGHDNRCYSHFYETEQNTSNKRKFYKIRKLTEAGFKPVVFFWSKDLEEDKAYTLERELILRFGRKRYDKNGILLNICIDGNPPGMKYSTNPELHKKRLSESSKGIPKSEIHRKRISEGLKGKPKSEEHRKNIGLVHKGKTISDEQKAKISKSSKGRLFSDEHKEKLRLAALERERKKRCQI
jgi:hypothetical protein